MSETEILNSDILAACVALISKVEACSATAQEQVFHLAEAEPLAAAALAVNLVYIGLKPFRYREKIRQAAQAELKELEGVEFPEDESTTHEPYGELLYLANLRDYKQLWQKPLRFLARVRKPKANKKTQPNGRNGNGAAQQQKDAGTGGEHAVPDDGNANGQMPTMPRCWWVYLEFVLFRFHVDKVLSLFVCGLASLALVLGVHQMQQRQAYDGWFGDETSAGVVTTVLGWGMVLPGILIALGSVIVYLSGIYAVSRKEQVTFAFGPKVD